jgi:hypothetical protein
MQGRNRDDSMMDIAGFIVLKAGVNRPVAEIEQDCIALIREKMGRSLPSSSR